MVRIEEEKRIRINSKEFFISNLLYKELLEYSVWLKMKSKGEKHSVSKVSKLNAVDTESIENVSKFVDATVTKNRLEQGLTYFRENGIEVDVKNTGQFLSWVVGDVIKEETDTILNNGLDIKKVKAGVATKARQWFLNKM